MRIVVLGGGFGGVATVRHLERVLRRRSDVEITLVSRENFFMLTPLLFEACSGRLELRHCAQPIRAALRRARFIEATVQSVEVDRQLVRAVAPEGGVYDLPYDHLVVALGASTNDGLIPGSPDALTFKTMADALVLRNHLIECFERADAAADEASGAGCLSIVVIGGGLVGIELLGELTAFADDVLRFYPRIRRDEVRFRLFEAGPRILPEIDATLAATAARVLERRGVDIRPRRRSARSSPDACAEDETIEAGDHRPDGGHRAERRRERASPSCTISVAGSPSTPRCGAAATRVWALGDCAAIPGPDGRPYPALAQHAVREGRHLAGNITAALDGRAPRRSSSASAWHHGVARAYARRRARVRCATHGLPRLVGAADLLPLSDAALGPAAAHCPRLDGRPLLPAGHHAG